MVRSIRERERELGQQCKAVLIRRVFTTYGIEEEEKKSGKYGESEKRGRVFANHPTELLLLLYLVSLTVLGLRLFFYSLFISICRRDGCCNNNDRLLRHSPSIVLLSAWSRPSGHTHEERERKRITGQSHLRICKIKSFFLSLSVSASAHFLG
jgi:hypothetical protein